MRSLVRRSFVLALVSALLLGVAGPVVPAALAARIPDTTVGGIDVDAATILELQAAMDAGTLTSFDLTRFYLQRIRKLNPLLNAVITVNSRAITEARAADQARLDGDDRPLLGIPVLVKDNVDTTGMPNDRRLMGAPPEHARRRVPRGPDESRRRDHHRQGEPVGMGELPVHPILERLERDRRPDEHGLRPRSQPVRVELRTRRRRLGRPRHGHGRHRDRRVDRVSVWRQRGRGHQADARAR